MEYNIVTKRDRLNRVGIIKYQLLTYCFINNINLSISELDCLYELVLYKQIELNVFCQVIADKKIFNSSQTVRNCLNKLEKCDLIIKEGKNKKNIFINPKLNIIFEGNIILDFKFLLNDTI